MEIRDISSEELKMIENYGSVLLQFYNKNSRQCEDIKLEIEKIPQEECYFQALRFEIEKDLELTKKFNIDSPTLVVIVRNEILGRKNSFMTAEEIHEWAHFSTIMGW